jgi:hypothetical protein
MGPDFRPKFRLEEDLDLRGFLDPGAVVVGSLFGVWFK